MTRRFLLKRRGTVELRASVWSADGLPPLSQVCERPLNWEGEGKPSALQTLRDFTTNRAILTLILLSCVVPSLSAAQESKDPVRVDDKTDAIIKSALKFLASKQLPNGAWGS